MAVLVPTQVRGRAIQINLRFVGSFAIPQEIDDDATDCTHGKQRQRPGIPSFKKF